MDPISDLGHIPGEIDHTQPDLMISESILASTWITCGFDIIGTIVPQPSDLISLGIIGSICTQIHRTSERIAIELIGIDLLIVGLVFAVEFEDDDWRIGIEPCITELRRLLRSDRAHSMDRLSDRLDIFSDLEYFGFFLSGCPMSHYDLYRASPDRIELRRIA